MQDLRDTEDGSSVAKLMHTSSWLRDKLATNFKPIALFEHETVALYDVPPLSEHPRECMCSMCTPYYASQQRRRPISKLGASRALHWHIWEAVLAYFGDCTARRHSDVNNSTMSEQDSKQLLASLKGNNGNCVRCRVTLTLDPVKLHGRSLHAQVTASSYFADTQDRDTPVTVADAIFSLRCALDGLKPELETMVAGAVPPFANTYQRALSGFFDVPTAGALIQVFMLLDTLDDDSDAYVSRQWYFDTRQSRPES